MSHSPKWKVYRNGKYVAACKHAEDAAILVAATGGVVKFDHSLTVWTEGEEAFSAGDSYDMASELMEARRQAHYHRLFAEVYGKEP